jgi:hypothetical protein
VSQKLGNVKRNILKSDAIVYENEHEVIKEFVEEKSNQNVVSSLGIVVKVRYT